LEEVLARLSKYYDERAEVEEKILSALLYPSFVIILCLFSLFVLLVFVLPNFKALFQDLGAEMPLYTQIIIGIGETFSKIWYLVFLLLLAVGGFIFRYKKTPAGALKIDQLLLKLNFVSRDQIILWFRTLGTLLKSGIPILEALNTTARSFKNLAFQEIIFEIKAGIENGEKLSSLLSKYKIFPLDSIQMVVIAENSGKLDEMLVNISDYYEKEKELFIKRFTVMLEPALTLFVGVVVGMITLAMFMPMMNVISKMQ
jgi:type II secretory pathway component PulF